MPENLKKWTTAHNLEILKVLNGRSNVYFVWNGTSGLLVDTGKKSSGKKLNKNLQQLKNEGKTIDFLALTHTHYDHCQNAAKIQAQENCKILVSKKEAEFCKNGFTPLPSGTFKFSRIIVGLGKRLKIKRFSYETFKPDILIENELELQEFGGLVRIISTPGHTAGSLSILVDNEIALVGDTLFSIFKNSVFPPFANDVPELIKSWGKLLNTRCRLFLPGHGREISRKLLKEEWQKYHWKPICIS
ncbi:MBL fold metallo-hydrolase [Mariniphaga sp.]|uniref:MBL fold metallo-hydrolase n=1 Tax=Mariniphaga sp. TaxID=1954475 RepID=UPI00356614E8